MSKAPVLESCPHCGNKTFTASSIVMSDGRKPITYCRRCFKLCSITVGELVFRYAGTKGE